MRLSRLEARDAVTELDRELVDALADKLAIGKDDLAIPPRWAFLSHSGGVEVGWVFLGPRVPLFSSPENAYARCPPHPVLEGGGARTVNGPLLNAREAAAYLAVSVSALRDLSRRGELPCVRVTERNTRWHRADLDAFVARRRQEFPSATVR